MKTRRSKSGGTAASVEDETAPASESAAETTCAADPSVAPAAEEAATASNSVNDSSEMEVDSKETSQADQQANVVSEKSNVESMDAEAPIKQGSAEETHTSIKGSDSVGAPTTEDGAESDSTTKGAGEGETVIKKSDLMETDTLVDEVAMETDARANKTEPMETPAEQCDSAAARAPAAEAEAPPAAPESAADGAAPASTAPDVSFADILEEPEVPAGDAAAAGDSAGAGVTSGDNAEKAAVEDGAAENATPAVTETAATAETAADGVTVQNLAAPAVEPAEVPPTPSDAPPAAGAETADQPAVETEPEPALTELEKLWKPVNENPADFTAWTLLIQYAEAQCFMEEIRTVLDKFLARYPYCYGYWKKYADLEKKRGTAQQCDEVFERALTAVPLSVDLWLHYLAHVRSANEEDVDVVRAAFERATAACGLEFRSDRLWEQYASWETLNKDPPRALAVYKRAIGVPTLSYRTHFENLEQFVGETPPQDLLTVEEFLEARRAVLAELKDSQPAPEPPAVDLLPPGCDEPPPGVPATPLLSADEEGVRLRAKILTPLRTLHKENEKQVSMRWTFEELIKRPYFHVKPLERGQLKNWKQYLDFEVEQGDSERIRVLFERCLIACALYEEYWVKYIRYLESCEPSDPDRVRAVYERACWTHLPAKPAIHMLWATFEEKMDDPERAAEVVERLCGHVSLLEVQLRRINLARRRGQLERAEQLYAEALRCSSHRPQAVIVAIKFVRFLYKVRNDRAKAEEVLREALRQDAANVRLYQQMVDLGFQARPVDLALCQEAFRLALDSPLELRDRALMAHRRCEFLEEFSDDVQSLQTAQEEYFTLARAVKAEAKKKQAEGGDGDAAKAGGAGVKRPASDTASTNGSPDKKQRWDSTRSNSGGSAATAAAPPATSHQPIKTVTAAAPAYTQPPPAPVPAYSSYTQPPPQPYYNQGYQYPQQQWGYNQYPAQPGYQYPQYGQPGYQYPYK